MRRGFCALGIFMQTQIRLLVGVMFGCLPFAPLYAAPSTGTATAPAVSPTAWTPIAQPAAADAADPLPAGAVRRFGTTRFRAGAAIRSLSFSQDGKRIVSATADGATIWDVATGRALSTLS